MKLFIVEICQQMLIVFQVSFSDVNQILSKQLSFVLLPTSASRPHASDPLSRFSVHFVIIFLSPSYSRFLFAQMMSSVCWLRIQSTRCSQQPWLRWFQMRFSILQLIIGLPSSRTCKRIWLQNMIPTNSVTILNCLIYILVINIESYFDFWLSFLKLKMSIVGCKCFL